LSFVNHQQIRISRAKWNSCPLRTSSRPSTHIISNYLILFIDIRRRKNLIIRRQTTNCLHSFCTTTNNNNNVNKTGVRFNFNIMYTIDDCSYSVCKLGKNNDVEQTIICPFALLNRCLRVNFSFRFFTLTHIYRTTNEIA